MKAKHTVFGYLPENPKYLISIDGTILKKNWNSSGRTKQIKQSTINSGHKVFKQTDHNILVHRAMSFVFPMEGEGHLVCHRNDIANDNKLENLYKGTHSNNLNDAYRNSKRPSMKGRPASNKGVGKKVIADVDGVPTVFNTLGLAATALGYASAGAVRNAILNKVKRAKQLNMEFYNES